MDCNGIDTCECFDKSLLENCQRFEPDPEEMRELWNHELDANTREAGEAENINYRYKADFIFLAVNLQLEAYNHTRFYSRVLDLKCKVPCEGKPIMRLRGEVCSRFSYYFSS